MRQEKYHFADTNEDLPYALFVSAKVVKDKKAPLIVALHGVFGDGNSLLRGSALDLAEDGGYISSIRWDTTRKADTDRL